MRHRTARNAAKGRFYSRDDRGCRSIGRAARAAMMGRVPERGDTLTATRVPDLVIAVDGIFGT